MLLAGLLGPALATPPGASAQAGDGSSLVVYLVTFSPGPAVWERFGHNAIMIRDTVTDEATAWDYGRFSFREPRFFYRFARGHTDYWMGRQEGVSLLNAYISAGRAVWLQELALSPSQRLALRDSLDADIARDSGRYRYDYYRSNCSTRLRDAIDLVTGGAVRRVLDTTETGTTFREHTQRALAGALPIYAGVMAALGSPTDRPISAWQESFLPAWLREHLRRVEVTGPDGTPVSLVRAEVALADVERHPVPTEVPRGPARWLAGLGVAGALLLLSLARLGRRLAGVRWAFLAVVGLWELAVAAAAILLLWFWGLSEHTATRPNLNVLHFSLVALPLIGFLPGLIRGEARAWRAARVLAWLGVGLSGLGLLVSVLPLSGQDALMVGSFALPLHAGVAGGFRLLGVRSPAASLRPGPS